jgi:hypothetical protein
VLDVATRKIVNHFVLNTSTKQYRFWGGAADPAGKLYYTVTKEIDKYPEHYERRKSRKQTQKAQGVFDARFGKHYSKRVDVVMPPLPKSTCSRAYRNAALASYIQALEQYLTTEQIHRSFADGLLTTQDAREQCRSVPATAQG